MHTPRARWTVLAGLVAAALGAAAPGGDGTAHTPPPDPDPGFLEFLGSVDGLAEVNPNYLAKADPARAARWAVRSRTAPAPPPPPPPSASGEKNNE